eukprot:663573-Amphidinium_carterae.1
MGIALMVAMTLNVPNLLPEHYKLEFEKDSEHLYTAVLWFAPHLHFLPSEDACEWARAIAAICNFAFDLATNCGCCCCCCCCCCSIEVFVSGAIESGAGDHRKVGWRQDLLLSWIALEVQLSVNENLALLVRVFFVAMRGQVA